MKQPFYVRQTVWFAYCLVVHGKVTEYPMLIIYEQFSYTIATNSTEDQKERIYANNSHRCPRF